MRARVHVLQGRDELVSATLSGEELLTVMEAGLPGAGAYLQFAGFSLRVRDDGHSTPGCRITAIVFEVSLLRP